MAETCLTCEYIASQTGECRRFPPTFVLVGSSPRAYWPVVQASDWCGEFQVAGGAGSLVLTSLTPNSLPAGSTPATVEVLGVGFDNTCTIQSNGVPRPTFLIDSSHLQYTARPDQATSGQVSQMTVVNGANVTSNALPLTFT